MDVSYYSNDCCIIYLLITIVVDTDHHSKFHLLLTIQVFDVWLRSTEDTVIRLAYHIHDHQSAITAKPATKWNLLKNSNS